jgi:hypothetical protein
MKNPAIRGGVFGSTPDELSSGRVLRVGRAAGFGKLAWRLIACAAAAGLRIGAAGRTGHSGSPRIALGSTLAGSRGRTGLVLGHRSLALSRGDSAGDHQNGRSQQC